MSMARAARNFNGRFRLLKGYGAAGRVTGMPVASEDTRLSAEQAAAVKAFLDNEEARLDSLYWIKDKNARLTRFKRNWAQLIVDRCPHKRKNVLKVRQLGISTYVAAKILDKCLFNDNFQAGVKDKTVPDAEAKLRKIRFAYEHLDYLPPNPTPRDVALAEVGRMIKQQVSAQFAERSIKFSNGSRVDCGASLRGDTLQLLHVSELARISVQAPKEADEVITGTLNTVSVDCEVIFESTHEGGKYGVNYEQVETAMANESLAPEEWTPLHFKFLFFPWYLHPEYRIEGVKYSGDATQEKYFADIERERGVKLDEAQKVWYVSMARTQRGKMRQEYPSSPEEALNPVMDGTIYVHELSILNERGDLGRNFEPADKRPIYISMDIGYGDPSSMWWVQPDGAGRWLWLDHFIVKGWGVQRMLDEVRKREASWGRAAAIIMPHDGAQHEKFSGISITDSVRAAGYSVIQVPRTTDVWASIDNVKEVLLHSVFHRRCKEPTKVEGLTFLAGLDAIGNYRVLPAGANGALRNMPLHDINSHPADAMRQFADALKRGLLSVYMGNNKIDMAPRRSRFVSDFLS